MIQNLAIYLPTKTPDFKSVFPNGRAKGGFLRAATKFIVPTEMGNVELGYMKPSEIPGHLDGFQGYVMQLGNQTSDKWKAIARVVDTKMVLGVTLPQPISDDSPLFAQFKKLAAQNNGFIFVADSILTEDGYLVGPASIDETDPDRLAMRAVRDANLEILLPMGFSPANNLPISDMAELRPKTEIFNRLAALGILFSYVQATEDRINEAALRTMMAGEGLAAGLTPEETEIFATPRVEAHKKFINSIGWKTENMWPLAWLLGYTEIPSVTAGMLEGDEISKLLAFAEADPSGQSHTLQPVEAVRELEDLFYCAHNAVRSAQHGEPTVPDGFDPIGNGGLIHERRHALSWALSPDHSWDDTDLST